MGVVEKSMWNQRLSSCELSGSVKLAEGKQHGVRENEGNLETHVDTQT